MGSRIVNVRLEEDVIKQMEALRDDRFPTQSDFVREAIKRLIREELRNRLRKEVQELAADREEMARLADMAEEAFPEFAKRWDEADRGER